MNGPTSAIQFYQAAKLSLLLKILQIFSIRLNYLFCALSIRKSSGNQRNWRSDSIDRSKKNHSKIVKTPTEMEAIGFYNKKYCI